MKNRTPRSSKQHRAQGSIIIYLVAILAVLGVVSLAATSYFSSSMVGTAYKNCPVAAQYLAEAGIRYAQSQLRAQPDQASLETAVTSLNKTYTVTGAGTFTLTVGPLDDTEDFYTAPVDCTATTCTDAATSTSNTQSTTVKTNIPTDNSGAGKGEITFDPEKGGNGIDDFGETGEGGKTPGGAIEMDPEEQTISLGNNAKQSYGCAWYNGNESECIDGVCELGAGFRAYFDVTFSSNAEADGFVFAIINADNNTVKSCGGDKGMGELLAYGGPGTSGSGLVPPKLGLEFDIFQNRGQNRVDRPGSRNDLDASRDHAAWVFWGQSHWTTGPPTYDDNRHGEGTWGGSANPIPPNARIPTNPYNILETGLGDDGYYYDETQGGAWLRDYNKNNDNKKFHVRVEVDRALSPNNDGNYCYTLKGWIVRDDVKLPGGYADVSKDYYDPANEGTWPQVVHSLVLDQDLHNKLGNVIFGWTVATGNLTQTIDISAFELTFKHDETTCAKESKPDDYVLHIPFYENQGGSLHNVDKNGNVISTGGVSSARWLKGKSCPECGSLFFNDGRPPARFWANPIRNVRTKGTVSTWVYLKDYNAWSGIMSSEMYIGYGGYLARKLADASETLSLQFTEDNYHSLCRQFEKRLMRFNPDRIQYVVNENSPDKNDEFYIDDGHKKPIFCVNPGKVFGSKLNEEPIYCVNSQYELELNKWYNLTATWDSTADEMKFYVNGTKTATFDVDSYKDKDNTYWDLEPAQLQYSNEVIVGAQYSSGESSFRGLIDELYVYDKVLTDDEIMNLYNDGMKTAQ